MLIDCFTTITNTWWLLTTVCLVGINYVFDITSFVSFADMYAIFCFVNLSMYVYFSCRQGHFEVFELIRKRKLYTSLVGNLMTLMKLGTEV